MIIKADTVIAETKIVTLTYKSIPVMRISLELGPFGKIMPWNIRWSIYGLNRMAENKRSYDECWKLNKMIYYTLLYYQSSTALLNHCAIKTCHCTSLHSSSSHSSIRSKFPTKMLVHNHYNPAPKIDQNYKTPIASNYHCSRSETKIRTFHH